MNVKISVVINTQNEERYIGRAIESVVWADEIIVCDMRSDDKTVEIAKKFGAKVFLHKRENYVEPVRNFALSKASNDWILVLDPDEEIPESLAKRLQKIASSIEQIDYVRVPRRNIIFNHLMKASMWWPDYNIRFFKKGSVKWTDKIHRSPETSGQGLDLPAEEEYAIIHRSYFSVSQFVERMNRYSDIQADELKKAGYQFSWQDLFEKPLSEFLSRFFANKGYQDGLHGLALSLLQAFSFLVVYLKVWESNRFKEIDISLEELKYQKDKSAQNINYWIKNLDRSENIFNRIFKKIGK